MNVMNDVMTYASRNSTGINDKQSQFTLKPEDGPSNPIDAQNIADFLHRSNHFHDET